MPEESGWRHLFPLQSQPRKQQEEAIDRALEHLYVSGKEYVVASLPTGSGKSAIAVTLARYLNSRDPLSKAYVLTSQKILQDQYVNDFKGFVADVRSSTNYNCSLFTGQTCGDTLRLREIFKGYHGATIVEICRQCEKKGKCPYKNAKKKFIDSVVGVTNYSYLLSETVYVDDLEQRELLVCDECHNIEESVRKWASVAINEQHCFGELNLKFPNDTSDESFIAWLMTEFQPRLTIECESLVSQIAAAYGKNAANVTMLVKKYTALDKYVCQVNRCIDGIKERGETFLVMCEGEDGKRVATFKPVDITNMARNMLYKLGVKKLLMSATILDSGVYKRSAGVPSSSSTTMVMPETFKPEAFGIVYKPIVSMAKKNIITSEQKLVKEIKRILDDNKDLKGIIHTSNYTITQMVSKIRDNRLLVQGSTSDRDKILSKHINSKRATVLVSPSMMEGLDLKDDLGRLQIICKVPFPYLGDRVTALKAKTDPQWYAWVTARTLIQAIGRSVRSESDFCKTYILDSTFGDFFCRWHKFFPETFSKMEVIDCK